jgi:uncharacterized protein (DUF4415 family)
MTKKNRVVHYTTKELVAMRKSGKYSSNWSKSAAKTQADIKASIAADPDEANIVIDWSSARVETPQPKAVLNMRVDQDILAFFKKTGRGYQTKINAILRSYVEHYHHQK